MNVHDLMLAIGETDETVLEATETDVLPKKNLFWRISAVAACLAAVVGIGSLLANHFPKSYKEPILHGVVEGTTPAVTDAQTNLPIIALKSHAPTGGEGSFSDYTYYMKSAEDITQGNPWSADTAPTTLPVYRNLAFAEETKGLPIYLDEESLLTLAKQAADAIGKHITDTQFERFNEIYTPDQQEKYAKQQESFQMGGQPAATNYDNVAYLLKATFFGGYINVYGNGEVTVFFEDGLKLPAKYQISASSTQEEQRASIAYIMEKYADFFRMEQPQIALHTDYTYQYRPISTQQLYDQTGDSLQQILNYNFSYAQAPFDDNGNLLLLRKINFLAAAQYLGDYPLISPEDARNQLLSGNLTDELQRIDTITPDMIAGSDLIYLTGQSYSHYLPYYRFILCVEPLEQGISNYLYVYIPAIEGKYLQEAE